MSIRRDNKEDGYRTVGTKVGLPFCEAISRCENARKTKYRSESACGWMCGGGGGKYYGGVGEDSGQGNLSWMVYVCASNRQQQNNTSRVSCNSRGVIIIEQKREGPSKQRSVKVRRRVKGRVSEGGRGGRGGMECVWCVCVSKSGP